MKVPILFCSVSSSLDAQTGQVSAFHIITGMPVMAVPVFISNLSVICLIKPESASDCDKTISRKIAIGDIEKFNFDVAGRFDAENSTWNITNIQNFLVDSFGEVKCYAVDSSGNTLAEYHFDIKPMSAPTVANTPATGVTPDGQEPQPQP